MKASPWIGYVAGSRGRGVVAVGMCAMRFDGLSGLARDRRRVIGSDDARSRRRQGVRVGRMRGMRLRTPGPWGDDVIPFRRVERRAMPVSGPRPFRKSAMLPGNNATDHW